jgi:hypothetical protein
MKNHMFIFIFSCGNSNYHSNNYGKACNDSIVGVAKMVVCCNYMHWLRRLLFVHHKLEVRGA